MDERSISCFQRTDGSARESAVSFRFSFSKGVTLAGVYMLETPKLTSLRPRWGNRTAIEALLASGTSVVCDRYAFSGLAFSLAKVSFEPSLQSSASSRCLRKSERT